MCILYTYLYKKLFLSLFAFEGQEIQTSKFWWCFFSVEGVRVLVWLSNFYSVEFQTYRKVANRIQWMLSLPHLIYQLLPSCRICSVRVCTYTHIHTCVLSIPLKVSYKHHDTWFLKTTQMHLLRTRTSSYVTIWWTHTGNWTDIILLSKIFKFLHILISLSVPIRPLRLPSPQTPTPYRESNQELQIQSVALSLSILRILNLKKNKLFFCVLSSVFLMDMEHFHKE